MERAEALGRERAQVGAGRLDTVPLRLGGGAVSLDSVGALDEEVGRYVSGVMRWRWARPSRYPRANGLAPVAWTASSRGTRGIQPPSCASRSALPNALDGEDLRGRPLLERKRRLAKIIPFDFDGASPIADLLAVAFQGDSDEARRVGLPCGSEKGMPAPRGFRMPL